MFEYEVTRVHYDKRKKVWILDETLGVYDTLDKALNAQHYDKTFNPNSNYYIEHRIKLDYAK